MNAIRSSLLALICLSLLALSAGPASAGLAAGCDGMHCADMMLEDPQHMPEMDAEIGDNCSAVCGVPCAQFVALPTGLTKADEHQPTRYDRSSGELMGGADPDLPDRPPALL